MENGLNISHTNCKVVYISTMDIQRFRKSTGTKKKKKGATIVPRMKFKI